LPRDGGFSEQGRGVCPSCNARRAHDTAIHLVENVLPVAPYRQWTLSFPMRLRFLLARDSALLSEVLGVFVRAFFCFQRKTARRLGVRKPFPGAVLFLQRFGSALQLTPHAHVLAPDGVFAQEGDNSPVHLCLLPPSDEAEVEELLRKVALRARRRLPSPPPSSTSGPLMPCMTRASAGVPPSAAARSPPLASE